MANLFNRKALIGMVHVQALPGSPSHRSSLDSIVQTAVEEARTLAESGFDALIIENMHDRPYVHAEHGPEIAACMTRIGLAVREAAARGPDRLPLGVQVLSGGSREALAIAQAIGASFIRCENFVFSHIADEGLLAKAEAGPLLRYRRQIGADHIQIFCDIKKKHASHSITADISLADAAEAAEFFGADGLIVTGTATAKPTSLADVEEARRASKLPVLVGSGVSPEHIAPLLRHADALIVGSWIKRDGLWSNPVDPSRCRKMAQTFNEARAAST